MCCDGMKSIFKFAVLLFTFGVCIHFAESKRHNPQPDEIEWKLNETHSILLKCTEIRQCDPGYGLSVQCGSTVSINVSIKCVPCVNGESYSDVKDHSVCKRCAQCGEHQERTGQCTLTADNIQCLEHECNKGYYWDKVTDDCHACSLCCNSSKEDVEQDCIDSGLPPQQQCRETHQTCPPPASPFTTGENVEERGTLSTAKEKLQPTNPANTSSPSLKLGLGIGLPLALIGAFFYIVLKKCDYISQVRTILSKFFCCCCNSWTLEARTVCHDKDVEAAHALLGTDVTLAISNSSERTASEEACKTIACRKNKLYRQSSCPGGKESDSTLPKFCRAHSDPGCQGIEQEETSSLGFLDSIHEEGFNVDKLSAQTNNDVIRRCEQHILQDLLPAIVESLSDPIVSEACSEGMATVQPPQLLPIPSKTQSTSTTGLLASSIELKAPDDYCQQLLNKKVTDIPWKFYSKICNSLTTRRDPLFDDHRLFGEKIGLTKDQTESLGQKENVGDIMLKRFHSLKDNNIGKLKAILEDMERYDISSIIEEWVQESFQELMVSSRCPPKISVTA